MAERDIKRRKEGKKGKQRIKIESKKKTKVKGVKEQK